MKKMGLVFGAAVALSMSAAQAGEIELANIYTDHCAADQSEVQLLNTPDSEAQVIATCEFGPFWAPNGLEYSSRLRTTVSVPYSIEPGMAIHLGNIDTNNCDRAHSLIALLNSRTVNVDTYCEAGNFLGHNGEVYRYRLNTTLRLN
jgi:hypothetical protein